MIKLTKENYKEYTSISSDEEFEEVFKMCVQRQKLRYIRNLMSVHFSYIELCEDGFLFGVDKDVW